MSAEEGKAVGEALLAHPDHELYDPAGVLELFAVEKVLGVRLPPSYRALLQVGGGGLLASGDLLLGTKDPEGLGATLLDVTQALREEGLPPTLLPIVDGTRFFCFDLADADAEGECQVVELDPEDFSVLRRCGRFAELAWAELVSPAGTPST